MSYGRMREESARLDREIADILGSAGRLDDEEDSRFGKEARGDDLPEGLRFRSTRLAKIRQRGMRRPVSIRPMMTLGPLVAVVQRSGIRVCLRTGFRGTSLTMSRG